MERLLNPGLFKDHQDSCSFKGDVAALPVYVIIGQEKKWFIWSGTTALAQVCHDPEAAVTLVSVCNQTKRCCSSKIDMFNLNYNLQLNTKKTRA